MARVAGVDSVEELCATLKKSQLLSPEQFESAEKLAAEGGDIKTVARRWVKQGLLTAWQAGQIVGGRTNLYVDKYRLVDQLGAVGVGRVYLAQHVTMNRRVALKVVAKRYSTPEAIRRFLAQVRSLAALDHRNVIRVYDVDQADDRYYLVMEYMEGRDLQKYVQRSGPLAPREAAELLRQAASGLAYAHAQGQVHGTLRPANLLVDSTGQLKIMNLGMAQLAPPDASALNGGEEAGTIDFAMPSILGEGEASAQGDLYAFGATAWFLLTGDVAIPTASDADQPDKLAAALRKQRPDIPTELAQICGSLLTVDGERQLASAADAEKALSSWLSKQPAVKPVEKPAAKEPVAEAPARAPARAAPAAPRKLAVAASLDAKPVTAPAPPPANDESPSISINLNLGGTRPAASAPPAISTSSMAAAPAIAASASTPISGEAGPNAVGGMSLPVLLGAAGGGVALLALIAVVAYIAFGGGGSPEVAGGPGKGAAAGKNPDDKANPASDPDDEGIKSPITPEPPENPAAAVTPELPAEPKPAEPVEPPATDPPATEPPVAEPAPVDPAPPAEPPPAEPKPPKPTPPKPTPPKPESPKPEPLPAEPAVKPLAEFPDVLELPIAGRPAAGAPSAADPVTLGKIVLEPNDIAIIRLFGGDRANGKNKLVFTLAAGNNGLADRDWEVKLGDPANLDAATLIAKLSLRDHELKFQWTDAALADDTANYLRNCLLSLKMGADEKVVPLRAPVMFEAYAVNLERPPAGRLDIKLEYLPDAAAVQLEVPKVEGFPADQRVEVKEASIERGQMALVLGKGDTETLTFKIDVTSSKRSVNLLVTPYFKVAIPGTDWQKLNPASLKKMQGGSVLLNSQLLARSQQLEKANAEQKKQPQWVAEKAQIDQAMGSSQLAIRQFDTLKGFHDAISGKTHIQFRVVYQAGDQTVLLAESVVGAEPMGRGAVKPAEPMGVPKIDLGPEQ